jgi:hypothetical protein
MSDVSNAVFPESIVSDKLKGVEQISEFIGEPVRRTFGMCQRGAIPVGKQGNYYIASKQALLQHYRKLVSGQL